jgi:asparagine synthase (glutamine-hydrolysing)
MREAVKLRLISDVPVGAFLSGGVDSGSVVAMMAEVTSGPVRTFSIGFDEASHNELPFAKLVAERYATEHHEIVVRPNAAEVLPHLVTHYGEPFADSSALPTYYVSKATREHVTVALSGDGGDESFAGYQNYAAVQAWDRADAIPAPLRTITGRTMTAILDRLPYTNTTARVSRAFSMLAGTLPERFRLQSTILKPNERGAAYTDAFRAHLASKQGSPIQLEWNEQMDALDWMMRHDQHFYLADCLMVKTDVASMANSLEVRCPLLDQELVEFAATIPSRMKRTPAGGKEIFKRAVRDLLPPQILTKPKTGFAMPVASWFRGELAPLLDHYLLDDVARRRGLFNPSFVRRLVTEHVAGRRDWSARLWALLCLEMWFRRFIDHTE